MMEEKKQPFAELITRTYPLAETAIALRDWDATPERFLKILIEVRAA
jgi:hypothetical protein